MDRRSTNWSAIVFLSILGLLPTTPSLAEYQEVHPCDEVAAHPYDKQKWGKGVTDQDLAPPRAIKQCTDALKQYPDTPRFHFQLGRALWLLQKFDEAVGHFAVAAEKGHAAAHAFVGEAYLTGLGGLGTNPERAIQSYEIAARGGFDPASDALIRAQKQRQSVTFRPDGFKIPEIVTALYKGDFAPIKLDDKALRYQMALYMNEFNNYFNDPENQYVQANLGQNPASCRQMYDPDVHRIITSNTLTKDNPFGATFEEQAMNSLNMFGELLQNMKTQGANAFVEPAMNVEVLKQQGRQDAMSLVATYGCESEVTRQIYRNIKPFLIGREGKAAVTDKRMAGDLTDGCETSGKTTAFCDCMLNTILKSDIASDDQELLAAGFSMARIERMKEKYPGFRDHSRACF